MLLCFGIIVLISFVNKFVLISFSICMQVCAHTHILTTGILIKDQHCCHVVYLVSGFILYLFFWLSMWLVVYISIQVYILPFKNTVIAVAVFTVSLINGYIRPNSQANETTAIYITIF